MPIITQNRGPGGINPKAPRPGIPTTPKRKSPSGRPLPKTLPQGRPALPQKSASAVIKTKAVRKFADGGSFTTEKIIPTLTSPYGGLAASRSAGLTKPAPRGNALGRSQVITKRALQPKPRVPATNLIADKGVTQGPESLTRPIVARPMKKGGTVKKKSK